VDVTRTRDAVASELGLPASDLLGFAVASTQTTQRRRQRRELLAASSSSSTSDEVAGEEATDSGFEGKQTSHPATGHAIFLRRSLLVSSFEWQVSFKLTASLADVGFADGDAFGASVSGDLSSAAFASALSADIGET
jgi:hypothetical protein